MAKRDFSDVMKEAIGRWVPSPEIGAIEAAREGVLAVAWLPFPRPLSRQIH